MKTNNSKECATSPAATEFAPGPESLGDRAMVDGRFADAAKFYRSAGDGAGGHTKAQQHYSRAKRARLCAAAPELYAALEAAHNQLVLLSCEDWTRTLSTERLESIGVTLRGNRAALASIELGAR